MKLLEKEIHNVVDSTISHFATLRKNNDLNDLNTFNAVMNIASNLISSQLVCMNGGDKEAVKKATDLLVEMIKESVEFKMKKLREIYNDESRVFN
jgi:hypothetical protein